MWGFGRASKSVAKEHIGSGDRAMSDAGQKSPKQLLGLFTIVLGCVLFVFLTYISMQLYVFGNYVVSSNVMVRWGNIILIFGSALSVCISFIVVGWKIFRGSSR